MARIRSIKPEFPQSESMGRVSRDARLLFVMLWPICDDHGRTRAASRMLASLLFPYDDDAPGLVDGWLAELERENCIRRYEANGSTFLQVCNWLIHQKIDKPSKPQFPEPPGSFANPREDSSLEGKGKEGKGEDAGEPKRPSRKGQEMTLTAWLAALTDGDAVPADDPIFTWAEGAGIPADWISIAWWMFEDSYTAKPKKYADWRAAFRDHCKRDFLRVWRHDARENRFVLTTAGETARREMGATA